jgi:hypothetical protein
MSAALIGFVGVIYAVIAVSKASSGDWGMFIVFSSYAMANVGLIMVSG